MRRINGEAASHNFNQSDGQKPYAGHPHGVRGDLDAVDSPRENAALMVVIRPKQAGAEAAAFAGEIEAGVFQRRPEQYQPSGHGEQCRAVTTDAGPVFLWAL